MLSLPVGPLRLGKITFPWLFWASISLGTGCTEVVELEQPEPRTRSSIPTASQDLGPPTSRGVEVLLDSPAISARTRDGEIQGGPILPEYRATATDARLTIQGELARYPGSFLDRIGLRQVVLCDGLVFDSTTCSAFADVEHGRIFLDVKAAEDRPSLRKTLHHELFHQADFADDGRLDADPSWEALNPPRFRYAQDAQRYQDDPDAATGPAPAGFLNRYATSSPTEDKAVLFSAMVTERAETRKRIEADPILRAKADRIRGILEDLGGNARDLIGP